MIDKMKNLALSIITSIALGLFFYWSYLILVTGLNPILAGLLGLILTTLLFFDIRLIRKSNYKVLGLIGLLLFGLVLPSGLIVNKKWKVNESQARRYYMPLDKK